MREFVYSPLDESNQEIRVLRLLPGDFNDPLCGILSTIVAASDPPPQYEALSYVWGSPKDSGYITIYNVPYTPDFEDGQAERTCLSLSRNLLQALPYLRHSTQPRMLWIDAICINQKDLEERSKQVQRMHSIFQGAQRTILWLGLDSGHAKLAFDKILHINSLWQYDFDERKLNVVATEGADYTAANLNATIYTLPQMEALAQLWQNPYFRRVWIFQEVQAAKSSSILQWGQRSILWEQFRHFFEAHCATETICHDPSVKPDRQFQVLANTLENNEHLKSLVRRGDDYDIESLLDMQKRSGCLDPRDRVYAILPQLAHSLVPQRVDYTKNVVDVYRYLAEDYYSKRRTLGLLDLCWFSADQHETPSWIPDLSKRKPTSNMGSGCHNLTHVELGRPLVFGDVLKAQGLLLGHIQSVAPLPLFDLHHSATVLSAILSTIKSLDLDLTALYPATGGNIAEALISLLRQDGITNNPLPPFSPVIHFDDLPSRATRLQKILQSPEKTFDLMDTHLLAEGNAPLTGRAIATTDTGYLTLVPNNTHAGDLLATFVGGRSTMAIRHASNDNQYRIVGQAWTAGTMHAEPFFGPLPKHIVPVIIRAGWEHAFLNQETNEITREDPRIDNIPCPPDWERVVSDDPRLPAHWHHIPSDKWWYNYDARLTASELIKRGLPIRDFDII